MVQKISTVGDHFSSNCRTDWKENDVHLDALTSNNDSWGFGLGSWEMQMPVKVVYEEVVPGELIREWGGRTRKARASSETSIGWVPRSITWLGPWGKLWRYVQSTLEDAGVKGAHSWCSWKSEYSLSLVFHTNGFSICLVLHPQIQPTCRSLSLVVFTTEKSLHASDPQSSKSWCSRVNCSSHLESFLGASRRLKPLCCCLRADPGGCKFSVYK